MRPPVRLVVSTIAPALVLAVVGGAVEPWPGGAVGRCVRPAAVFAAEQRRRSGSGGARSDGPPLRRRQA